MIELKSVFPFTKSFFLNGKDYIFSAYGTKIVGEDFLDKDGNVRFPGLEIVSTLNNLGQTQEIRRVNARQEWIFIFEKDGKVQETTELKEFCNKNGLNWGSVRTYIKQNLIYRGWKISRRRFTEKETELYEKGIPFALWQLKTDLNNDKQ